MQQTLARFDPLGDRPVAVSERHYREVHVRLAIEMLGSVPSIVQYSTYRVLRQYDATGGWNKRPSAWRFASQIIQPPPTTPAGEVTSAFPEEVRRVLAQDHRNCLRHLRRFDVQDRVLLQTPHSPTPCQRYFFEFERTGDYSIDSSEVAFVDTCESLGALADGVPGVRSVIRRTVASEAETDFLDDAGQLLTGRLRATTSMVGYLEFRFDSHYAAEPFFQRQDVRGILRRPAGVVVEGYEVMETVGFDKRM